MTGHDGGVLEGAPPTYDQMAGTTDQRAVWARLAKQAWPYLEAFHGDLIHDFAYIRQLWDDKGFEFYYGVRTSGTTLTPDPEFWAMSQRSTRCDHAWKVRVVFRWGHYWDVIFEPINQ